MESAGGCGAANSLRAQALAELRRSAQALGGADLPGRRALKCRPLRYSQRRREIRLKRYFA